LALRLRNHKKKAIKLTMSRSTPSETPIPIPSLDVPFDDVELAADVVGVVDSVMVVRCTVVDEEVQGIATDPDIAASVESALGAGIEKLPQPGEAPQTHVLALQPQDH
jgi:hypothetical protein